ncbi:MULTISPECIES: hypothetical protein [Microbulbifer]|uniref:DUF4168 domain-containing protein n=1 Tax=Microbulbifer celer TaxID=435905 RepID=A0ABW3UC19_9GAMM|nr:MULTISPECIES: hypothetical protein [Microbulbifer]UFN58933.1 hypothetical protein LPW13_07805 [Microbulbifer celer]
MSNSLISTARGLGFALAALALPMQAVSQMSDQEIASTLESDPLAQMIVMSASMHALAKDCGDYTDLELIEMKSKQREMAVEKGMDGARFDQIFSRFEERAEQGLAEMPPEKRKAQCEQLKKMKEMGDKMGG